MTGGEIERRATRKIEKIDGGDMKTKVKRRKDSDALNKTKLIATDTLEIDGGMILAGGRIGIAMIEEMILTKGTWKMSEIGVGKIELRIAMTGISSKEGQDKEAPQTTLRMARAM
jgi:hypothetical protein